MELALHATSPRALDAAQALHDARLDCDEGESIDELPLHWTSVWVRWTANDHGDVTITGVDINGETIDADCFAQRVLDGWKHELEGRIVDARREAA